MNIEYFFKLFFVTWVVFLPGFVLAQTTPNVTIQSTQATLANGKVTVTWTLSRATLAKSTENITLIVQNNKNQIIKQLNSPFAKTGSAVSTGNIDDQFFISLVDHKNNDNVFATKAVTVVKSGGPGNGNGSSPDPAAGAGTVDNGPCNKSSVSFGNTIFGAGCLTAGEYFHRLYIWAVSLAILAATISIIRGGYIYAVGRGNPSSISSAKELIINALVGLALLVLSYTILRFLLGEQRIQTGWNLSPNSIVEIFDKKTSLQA